MLSAAGSLTFGEWREWHADPQVLTILLSMMRKQGHPMLPALGTVFLGRPLPVAWGT